MKSVEQRLYYSPTVKRATGVPCGKQHLKQPTYFQEESELLFMFVSKQMDVMQPQFCSLASNLQVEDIVFFENSIGCKSIDVCIWPFPRPWKKALAICVQSQN